MNDICVVGYPSKLGGADTELDHQIRAWQALGLRVHLIPTGPLDDNLRAMRMDERECVIHHPRDWGACRDMHVISYCNGEFLKNLPTIKQFARTTTFVNCMCWLFDDEKEMHRRGLIDCFLYQTDHAREKVQADLLAINSNFRWFKVRPYFHLAEFPFTSNRSEDMFRFARISREDLGKYHPAQLWVYETMVAPVLKEGVMLGVNDQIRAKIGKEPNWISGLAAGALPVHDVYRNAHCIGFEAMASGCLLIVDDRGGWRELVLHGQTGFLCKDQREFVYYSSRAAFEQVERRQMAADARQWVETNWGVQQAKEQWSQFFAFLENL